MKKQLAVIALCLLNGTLLFSQQRDKTLFNRSFRAGFFLSPLIEYSNFDKETSTSIGGGLGFITGDFFVGAYGLGMAEWGDFFENDGSEQLELGHGGLWFGLTFQQHEVLHLFSSVKLGWGAINIDFEDDDFNFEDDFLVFTPEAGIEINLTNWFRIAATGGYRFVEGLDEGLTAAEKDLESFTGTLTLRFGWFGRRR